MSSPRRFRSAPAWSSCVALALAAVLPAQQITLRDLPELARARSERQRPLQLQRLEPYLPDLETDYGRNSRILDEQFEKVAQLGDAVVPLLIEFLTPENQSDSRSRWRAANAARVLERLDPRAHLDTWLDLLGGDHPLGRRHALRLLAAAGPDPRSAAALAQAFPTLGDTHDLALALRTATTLETGALAPLALPALASPEPELRAAALDYLTRFEYREGITAVVEALRRETENALLERYIRFLQATVEDDEAIADALVPLIEGVRLGPDELRQLVDALATIAPENHRETRRVLLALLERGEIGPLAISAALTLLALDDKSGARILFDNLDQRIRQRRGEATAYADRADAYFAFGKHKEAIRDYEQAIKASDSASRKAAFHLQIARCEAHRDSSRGMLRAIQESGLPASTVRIEASKDPVFHAMLQKDDAQRFLKEIER